MQSQADAGALFSAVPWRRDFAALQMSDEEGEGDWEDAEQDKWVVAKKSACGHGSPLQAPLGRAPTPPTPTSLP